MKFNSNTKQYIKENWKEWFKVIVSSQFISEGCMPPVFFLPVREIYAKNCVEYWFFIFAPFVYLFYLSRSVFKLICRDFVRLLRLYDAQLDNKDKNNIS